MRRLWVGPEGAISYVLRAFVLLASLQGTCLRLLNLSAVAVVGLALNFEQTSLLLVGEFCATRSTLGDYGVNLDVEDSVADMADRVLLGLLYRVYRVSYGALLGTDRVAPTTLLQHGTVA